jgi:hypothetical protein
VSLAAILELNTVKLSLDPLRERATAAKAKLAGISTTDEIFLAKSQNKIDALLKEVEAALGNADLTSLLSSSNSLTKTSQDLYKKISESSQGTDTDLLEKELSLTADKIQQAAQKIQGRAGQIGEKLEVVSSFLMSLESPKVLEISVSAPGNADSIEVAAVGTKESCLQGCKSKLPAEETVTLTIKPKPGFSTKMGGDCSTSKIVMDTNKRCEVTFTK